MHDPDAHSKKIQALVDGTIDKRNKAIGDAMKHKKTANVPLPPRVQDEVDWNKLAFVTLATPALAYLGLSGVAAYNNKKNKSKSRKVSSQRGRRGNVSNTIVWHKRRKLRRRSRKSRRRSSRKYRRKKQQQHT